MWYLRQMRKTLTIVSFIYMTSLPITSVCQDNQSTQMPEITEEDIKAMSMQLEAQLEEEIDKQTVGMSPDEKKQFKEKFYDDFYKEATQLAEKIQKSIDDIGGEEALKAMSDEDAIKFFEGVFADEAAATPAAPKPEPEIKLPVKKEEPKKISSKQEAILETINSIIARLNSFVVKAQSINDELSSKMPFWLKKEQVTDWGTAKDWHTIRVQIDGLLHKLEKARDRDPRTREFRYLDDIIADEVLVGNLNKLQKVLVENEPKFEVSPLKAASLSAVSKKSLQTILKELGKSIHTHLVSRNLDTIFEKYEPKAKAIREQEEAVIKKAQEEAKKPGKPISPPLISTATRRPERVTTKPGADRWQRPQYEPSYRAPYSQPAYGPYYTEPSRYTPPSAAPQPGAPVTPGLTDKDKRVQEPSRGPEYQPKKTENRAAKRTLSRIDTNLEAAANTIKQSAALQNLVAHATDKSPVNEDLMLNVQTIVKKLSSPTDSVLASIEQLNRQSQKLSPEEKQALKKELKEMVDEHQKEFDKVIQQVNIVKNNWAQYQATMPAAKRDQYFVHAMTSGPTKQEIVLPEQPVLPAQPVQPVTQPGQPLPGPAEQPAVQPKPAAKKKAAQPVRPTGGLPPMFALIKAISDVRNAVDTFEAPASPIIPLPQGPALQ